MKVPQRLVRWLRARYEIPPVNGYVLRFLLGKVAVEHRRLF